MRHVTNKMRHITKMTKARNKAVPITRAVNSRRENRKGIAEDRNRVGQALLKNSRVTRDTRAGNPSSSYAAGVRGGVPSWAAVSLQYFRDAARNRGVALATKGGDGAQRLGSSPTNSQLLETIMESNYLSRDTYGMYKNAGPGPGPALMGADTLIGNDVYNTAEESLGTIKEFMIDMSSGNIHYAVLSYGGFLGMGDRLFAVPWQALKLDTANKRFTLNASKEQLKNAPGFDKDHWPAMADTTWASDVHKFYGVKTTGRIQ
jgi:sporulation protein YlmC with PRC-barrel domain